MVGEAPFMDSIEESFHKKAVVTLDFDTRTVFCRKQIHLNNITYRLWVDRLARKTLMSTFLVKIKILFSKCVKNIDMELEGKIFFSKHQRMSKCK